MANMPAIAAHRGVKRWLVARVGARLCALPLDHVVEILRPLPVEPIEGAPSFVLGLCILRGAPTPVVDAAGLLGEPAGPHERFVAIKVDDRLVALGLGEVRGLHAIDAGAEGALPPLLQGAAGDLVAAVSALDAELLLVLNAARMIPDDVLSAAGSEGARR
jgi:purine-binding chemotaxis protein CheW